MKFETKLSKEQFLEAIKVAVRVNSKPEVFDYHYRVTAAQHLAQYAREQWDNEAYVSMFMGEPFTKFETVADVDAYFSHEYDLLLEQFECYEEVDEADLDKDTVYTPEQFVERLEVC